MSGPRFATPRSDRPTYGHEVAKLAEAIGFRPMDWQTAFWNLALEHENGRLVRREIVLTIARQCGKTSSALALMLWRCLKWPRQNVKFAAQSGLDARSKLGDDFWPMLEHSPIASCITFRRQSGHEALLFDNGSRLGLVASSEKSGHGSTVDAAFLDEVWAQPDFRLEQSLRPAMVTRPNAQLYISSTAGTEQRSPYLWEKVTTGRQIAESGATDTGVCYVEYSAHPDADPSDPEVWRSAIPAMGVTIEEDAVRANFLGMRRNEFRRAFLNQWTNSLGDAIVAAEDWQALAEPDSPRPDWVVLGVDVGPRDATASIVAVGAIGDCLHSAILENGPGTDWLSASLERVCGEWDSPFVLVDGKSVAHLMPELERASDFRIRELGASDIPTACRFWHRLVLEGRLKHRGEIELARALDGSATRTLGDGWAFSRRNSGVDITPLVAQALAASFWLGSWGGLQDE